MCLRTSDAEGDERDEEPPGALDVEWSIVARITEPSSDGLSRRTPAAAVGNRKATKHRPPNMARFSSMCGDQVSDDEWRPRDVKPSNALLDGAIAHDDALMLS